MIKIRDAKIGMVGLGYWGRNILRNLCELDAVCAACDSNPQILKKRKKEFPNIHYTPDFNDILKDQTIRAVVISTPANTHYELAREALNEGKDVFVEKPIALTFAHGKELVELAKERKKIIMVGHILQYHPAIIKLKKLIDNEEIGKVQYIYSNRLNIGKLRIEENILWSFAPHDISALLMLIGDEPLKVECFGEGYLNEEIYDVTLTNLQFKNKIKAHIFVSWLHPFKEQKLVVVGSKGMAVFDDLIENKLSVYPHRIEWRNGKIPIAHKAEQKCIKIENKEPLKEELKHFIECVVKKTNPKTDGEEGLKVLKVLEEAEKSLRNKNLPAVISQGKKNFIHPSSYVEDKVEIGEGTKIWHFCHILEDTKIGKNCIIGQNVMIGPNVEIGNGCKIQNNVSIYKGVMLEDRVFCGPSCVFTNVYNPRAFIERKREFLPTLVKKGATIGANATILCGVTIGKYAFIGAGAVVKKDVPDYTQVVGVPARVIGYSCKCGTTLKFYKDYARCDYCGNEYNHSNDEIKPILEKE